MTKQLADDIVPVEERIALLKQLSSFSSFTLEQIKELSHLMKAYCYTPNEIIVQEGEIIDSVYFILQGEAEVNHRVPYLKKWMAIPVAVLRAGETIGLSDTGFYSDTGTRTATVVALSELIILRLDINDFHRFLRKHQLTPIMFAAAEQMLRMHLIKQSLPFAKLSSERLRWLSERIEVVTVPARTVLFKQGEQGDRCFLIESGEVEIVYDEGENKRVLASLKRPMLFGEATFLSHSVRNATAITVTDCHLLMLRYEYLSELMSSENDTSNMLMTLMVDRSRPTQVDSVQVFHRSDPEGNEVTILKNPKTDDYFKLSPEGYYIWQKLDGKNTLQDITLALAEEYQVFSPDLVAGLISKLAGAGFLENLKIEKSTFKNKQAFWIKSVLRIRDLFENRIAINNIDKWLQPSYKTIHFLFAKPVLIVFSLAILAGFGSFIFHTEKMLAFVSKEQISLVLLLVLIPYAMFEAFLHELGHAYAVKARGRQVQHMGIGWYWFVPFVYTDTSDMWVADRSSRVYVNFAGIFIDLLIAGILAISLLVVSNPYAQSLLWLFAFYTYISAFRMLNPLHDTDGYYLLMDTLEKTRLRRSSVEWLLQRVSYKKEISHAEVSHKAEIIYWLVCAIYLILLTGLTWLIQHFVFVSLNISVMHPAISLILPFLVLLFSCLSMVAEIRSQANE